jgi:CP family cyanate transporter-like MFS transporter
MLAGADDVHRLTAAMFTISYSFPFVASLIGGAVWDATGRSETAFLPVAFVGVLMMGLARGLKVGSLSA